MTNLSLSARRKDILKTIVEEYTNFAIPVPSSIIKHRNGGLISSATIRSEMSVLEDSGYIIRKHSSAGCLPTAKGYRFYVEFASTNVPSVADLDTTIRGLMKDSDQHVEGWTRAGAEILSNLSGNLGLATVPTVASLRVRNFHLVYLNVNLFVMVLVFDAAYVYKELISLPDPVTIEDIDDLVSRLNVFFASSPINDIDSFLVNESIFEQQILQSINRAKSHHYRMFNNGFAEGLRYLLAQPEFSNGSNIIALVEAVESGRLLQMISGINLIPGEIKVIIGDENNDDAFKPMGMVLAGYGFPETISGIIGIIGPMRMHYHATMSMVAYLSSVMSELIYEL